ncbi:hypothetical protein Q73A0000_05630 [Kaistella flava (ex Peng et al. 2021)]|uniref:Uncharacterized protein n=1 Tax=Kaistella flava (ex Peng et al. 2021) TaxID=2038776 RepID=A0A7M2Y7S9_9FLAO|nr:hypothetical protein [Kaistella flava (ex Peng et al. 2021)]QOW09879.1 hypothetical protein Q73A0000_05630 [Kaistella flava (ex Peng et al. 2021)]
MDFKYIESNFNKNYIFIGYFKCDDLNIRVESTADKSDFKHFMKLGNPEEITFFSSQKFYLNTNSNAKLFVKEGIYYIERLATERKLLGMNYPRRNTIYEVTFTNNELVLRNLTTKEYCEKYEIINW